MTWPESLFSFSCRIEEMPATKVSGFHNSILSCVKVKAFAASSVKNIRRGDSHRPRSVVSELVPVCIALSRRGLLSSSRPTSAGIMSRVVGFL